MPPSVCSSFSNYTQTRWQMACSLVIMIRVSSRIPQYVVKSMNQTGLIWTR